MPADRIVSLIPSATEIVCALGAVDRLVGRSHECDWPPVIRDRPICSFACVDSGADSSVIDESVRTLLTDQVSLYGLNTDLLDRVRPDLIITQTQCDVCAVSLADVRQAISASLPVDPELVVLAPTGLADVRDDIVRVADAIGCDPTESLKGFDRLLARVRATALPGPRPRVLCVEWIDPPMAAGNWVPELVAIAGGESLLATNGRHSPYLTVEQVAASDPDVVIFMPCGFDLPRTVGETQSVLNQPPWSSLRAVRDRCAFAVDANAYFNRPGPRLADSAAILHDILHDVAETDAEQLAKPQAWVRVC